MNCSRCETDTRTEAEPNQEFAQDLQNDQIVDDIGGFAEISGCLDKLKCSEKQIGTPLEEDLGSWGHHSHPITVPDAILQASAGDEVTFVFTNQVDGKLVPVESAIRTTKQNSEDQTHSHQKEAKSVFSSKFRKVQPLTPKENLITKSPSTLPPNSLKWSAKSPRTPSNFNAPSKVNVSSGNQPSLKRTLTSDAEDDDFM